MKLRNPWGSGEWKGDWSDESDLWTPELRRQVGMESAADDGVFCIDLENYMTYFTVTSFCCDQSEYYKHSQCTFSFEDDDEENFAP